MKAWVRRRYGSTDALELIDAPMPEPAPDQALIRVRAASINRSDWETLVGSPFYARLGGLRRPKEPRIGSDIAGVVEAVGPAHETFAVGDEVFGDILARPGGFAEYVCARGTVVARKPPELSFEVAAALPQAGVIALQAMRGRARAGARVLINGAGGGVGSFAIQLAKREGAELTAVDAANKHDFARALGADHVVDHTTTDFTKTGERYDLILDVIGTRGVVAYRRSLARAGRALVVGGLVRHMLPVALVGPVLGRVTGARVGVLAVKPNRADLETVGRLVADGTITAAVDRVFTFEELPEAMRHLGEGRVKGKVVVGIT